MTKYLFFILLLPEFISGQNYIGLGDSCFAAKDYVCAGTNFDLYLLTDNSNGIAYRSVTSWSLAKNREKTLSALLVYVKNNYENGIIVFSQQLANDEHLIFLKDDQKWKDILNEIRLKESDFVKEEQHKVDSSLAIQKSLETASLLKKIHFSNEAASTIYKKIKQYNSYPSISRRFISMQFQITDSLHTAYLLLLPTHYNSKKSYKLLFSLHGAVSMNIGYPAVAYPEDTSGWNRYYTKYARDVVMVYPLGNNMYNWMYPDQGFFMIPEMLKQIKEIINIDDNKVFVTGHSNGATGSFSYLLKQPSPFAAFYGFNTRPRIETGGTYIKNILNRSYFNVSTDNDYYYPPSGNDTLSALMNNIGADYHDHRYIGFPHWFPSFDESEPAHKLLFEDLKRKKRNPFHPNIYWECDDPKYGQCDWIKITELDTLVKPASWHNVLNFQITKWVVALDNNKFSTRDTLLQAFNNSKKSGAIRVSYKSNNFTVETSRIRSFSILLSPEMVDESKPITVIVNGKLYKRQRLTYNKDFIIQSFIKTVDRSALWVNQINVKISQ